MYLYIILNIYTMILLDFALNAALLKLIVYKIITTFNY